MSNHSEKRSTSVAHPCDVGPFIPEWTSSGADTGFFSSTSHFQKLKPKKKFVFILSACINNMSSYRDFIIGIDGKNVRRKKKRLKKCLNKVLKKGSKV